MESKISTFLAPMVVLLLRPLFFLCLSSPVLSAPDSVTFSATSSAVLVRDSSGGGGTLVSATEAFQLGFFTPNGSEFRYLGIWYRNRPSTVVWVANREFGLQDSTGFLCFTTDGNLQLFDGRNDSYWSTGLQQSIPSSENSIYSLKLMDSGNLILTGENTTTLWQSFDHPTDTFLPGMKMVPNLNLTSWSTPQDPSPGNYVFQLDQESLGKNDQFMILNNSIPFWKSQVSGFVSFILTDYSIEYPNYTYNITHGRRGKTEYSNSRFVMAIDGRIQFFPQAANDTSPSWAEPSDFCSQLSACGSFGSCNSDYRLPCNCLPGFLPKSPENWNSGDFSEGCARITQQQCHKKETFLNLKVATAQKPTAVSKEFSEEEECRGWCREKCNCQAYALNEAEKHETECRIWLDDLKDIEEIQVAGPVLGLNLRVSISDIELTKKDCKPCGTIIVPYPLGTGPNCGDPLYSSFACSNKTGLLSFVALSGSYTVTRIDKQANKFYIQVGDEYCGGESSDSKDVELDQTLPFIVDDDCNADTGNLSLGRFRGDKVLNEIGISWELPSEPLCGVEDDCSDWPNSSCGEGGDGKRCLCNGSWHWDGSNATCSQNVGIRSFTSSLEKKRQLYPIIFGILGGVLLLGCAIVVLYMKRRRRKATGRGSKDGKDENLAFRLYDSEKRVKEFMNSGQFGEDDKKDIDVPFFELDCILAATDFFSNSNKLGQGGFGPVYKGKFPGGQEIAVKRLSSASAQGLEEFKNEVLLIAKLQHRNLVRLLGYCVEGNEKILLYEYMPNKSLDFFIFDRERCKLLNWEMRFNIIMGIARGLLYLHHDSRLTIIHRDMKTSNVLLDDEMNPKISDFGMARIVAEKQTEVNTVRVVGTYGYMSPEYALDGCFSTKSDVFSFGVVVLEILCGKRNSGFYNSDKALSLMGYAWGCWREEKAMEVMDVSLSETCNGSEFLRCVTVALLCVQEDPNDRPTMANVLFMLGSDTASLPRPKEPAFSARHHASSSATGTGTASSTSFGTMETTTELEGR
ncbi:unnamed protein product [Linum trigynum]|uniref:non-specific serine/threonine protein kinase n=1 Tax=Linum trigynum TaxID=586398 RepID=A0AAV2F6R4_9ROSI